MKTFKYCLLLFLIFPLCMQAQKTRKEEQLFKKNKAYYESVFGKKDKDFKITAAPSEWATEPVVVLSQKTYLTFKLSKIPGMKEARGIIRKRLLLQDKSAVEDFSEFYYQDVAAIWIKHIKPNGKTKMVNLDEAVKVETEVPRLYADSYQSGSYLKVAIPDLEVGDILDYVKVFTKQYAGDIGLIESIAYTYPVVRQEIIVDSDKVWTVNLKSFNGAPKFKQSKIAGLDWKGKQKKTVRRMILVDEQRSAVREERWTFPFLSEPIYKASIQHTGFVSKNRRKELLAQKNIDLKTTMVKTVMEASVAGRLLESATDKRLRRIKVRKMKPKKQITAIYEALRYEFLIVSTNFKSSDQNILRSMDEYNVLRDDVFAALYSKLLKKYGIESSVVAVVPRFFGEMKSALTYNEITYGVYVPKTKKYYWKIDNYRQMDDEYFEVAGAEGYKLDRARLDKSDQPFKKVTIPVSDAANHLSQTDLKITVQSDNTLAFENTVQFTGQYKDTYSSALLYQTNYLDEDFDRLTPEKDKTRILKKRKKKKSKKSKDANYRQKKAELGQQKTELIERWLKRDFEVKELDEFAILSYGRMKKDEPLSVEVKFSSDAYLKKAGPNLIFEVGKLISGQIALEEEEMKNRMTNIELGYARTIVNTIQITLPAAYQAQGLDKLNMAVDNANSAFVSTAVQEGNLLKIKTTKTYKKATVPQAEWASMVEMLEAAYKFSQQKIILKK